MRRLGTRAKTAAAKVEKTVRVAARDLAKTGETFAKAPRAFVEDVVESGKGFGEKLSTDVKATVQKAGKEAARRAEDVTKMVTTPSARPSRRVCTASTSRRGTSCGRSLTRSTRSERRSTRSGRASLRPGRAAAADPRAGIGYTRGAAKTGAPFHFGTDERPPRKARDAA